MYFRNDTMQRILFKAFGLRIIITCNGQAKKFDILVFTISIGSGIELFAFARYFADFIMLKFVAKKKLYKNGIIFLIIQKIATI